MYSAYSTLPTPNPWQPLIFFTVSIVLLFLECYTVGIIQSVTFSDWFFFLLSNIHLRFLHVFSCLDSTYPFSWLIFHCLNAPQFIYPFLVVKTEKAMAPHSSTLPGKSHGWRSLVGCSPWGHEKLDTYWATSLSSIGEGNGNALQCSCLENPRDGGAWWAAVYGSHRVGHDWSDLAAAAAVVKNLPANAEDLRDGGFDP